MSGSFRKNSRKYSRSIHLWLSLVIFIPVIIVIASGLLLQNTQTNGPTISFDDVLHAVKQVPEVSLNSWDDIDRLDVRPTKGIIKVRGKNHWEVQLNAQNGDVLQVAYRRTDTIEAIHDGSWFFEGAKLWLFLPAALLLFVLWVTGLVMLYTTMKSKYRKNKFRQRLNNS